MRDELLRRALVSIPQLLLMSFITFLFIDLAPVISLPIPVRSPINAETVVRLRQNTTSTSRFLSSTVIGSCDWCILT